MEDTNRTVINIFAIIGFLYLITRAWVLNILISIVLIITIFFAIKLIIDFSNKE